MLENYFLFKAEGGAVVYKSESRPVHYICKECRDEGRGDYELSNQGMLHICPSCDEKYQIMAIPKISRKRIF